MLFDRPVNEKDHFLETAVTRAQLAMVASDLKAEDEPIIFANEAFEKLTGYSGKEILGRNCRFLQGPDTSPDTVEAIRKAVADGQEGYFEILNYKKDGTPFWNGLHIGPVSDPGGTQSLFFGSQRDITREIEARQLEAVRMEELRHRMGNLMAIVGIIIRNSNEGSDVQAMQDILQGRIAALGAATELIYPKIDASNGVSKQSLEPRTVEIETIIRTIIGPLGNDHRFELAGPPINLPERQTTNTSLVIHELSTNAAKHGALSQKGGKVSISWAGADDRILFDWVETGCTVKAHPERKGLGKKLLDSIVASSQRPDAALLFAPSGVICRFDVAMG
nr:PAS domain-containing protein [Pacificimonas pallii]